VVNSCELLIALFVGMFAAFKLTLDITKLLIERRQVVLVFEGRGTHSYEIRRHVLLADWLPLWAVSLVFLLCSTGFFYSLPALGGVTATRGFATAAYICALLAFVGFVVFVIGGWLDLRYMWSTLHRESHDDSQTSREEWPQ
jgi:hypothetical protein